MRFLLILALVLATGAGAAGKSAGKHKEAEQDYQQARTAYYALKKDAARRKLRHNWLSVASRFSEVAKKYPSSPRAPDALFTSAELHRELSRISRVDADLSLAMTEYARLVEEHPKHRLADDASLALAKIYLERLDRPEDARRVLTRGIARSPRGDMVRPMKALLATLPAAPTPPPAEPKRPTSKGPGPAAVASASKASEPPQGQSLLDAIARVAEAPTYVAPAEPGSAADAGVSVALGPPGADAGVAASPSGVDEKAHPTAQGAAGGVPLLDGTSGAAESAAVAEVLAPSPGGPAQAEPLPEAAPTVPPAVADVRPARPGLPPGGGKAQATPPVIRRIVIDPGHGGHDSGALGRKGTREKDVALSISKKLGELLTARGFEVVLTRTTDRFIRLEDRARIANDAKGDLFLSIHCNAAKSRSLRGIETYTLNVSSDRYSIRLAARENSSTEEGLSDLQFILADLDTKANTEDSSRLASKVQESLVSHLKRRYSGVKDLGTKEALFYVLLGAKMPAILVETSFISHPDEEQRLKSAAYQQDVARAIADGVQAFAEGTRRVAKID